MKAKIFLQILGEKVAFSLKHWQQGDLETVDPALQQELSQKCFCGEHFGTLLRFLFAMVPMLWVSASCFRKVNKSSSLVLTRIFVFSITIVQILIIAGKDPATIPYGVRLWARIIRPLHGLFNILLFTYPHTKKRLKEEPELSYLKALVKVIRSGCDADESDVMGNARNGSDNSTNRLRRSRRSFHSNGRTTQNSELRRKSSGNLSALSQPKRELQFQRRNSECTLNSAQTQSTRRLQASTRSLFYETSSAGSQSTRRLQFASTRSLFHENASVQSQSTRRLQSNDDIQTITNNTFHIENNDIEEGVIMEETSSTETNAIGQVKGVTTFSQ